VRLEVTRKSDLAVRSLRALGAANTLVKGPALAELVGTSAGFVAQALTPLVRAGWVHSEPGPTGGYSLATDLGDISVLAVIEAVEGPTDGGQCVLADHACDQAGTCALHVPWQTARAELLRQLDSVSVGHLGAVESTGLA